MHECAASRSAASLVRLEQGGPSKPGSNRGDPPLEADSLQQQLLRDNRRRVFLCEPIARFVVGRCDNKEFTRLDALQSFSRCDWIIVSVFPPRFCG
jgi:hypothetical protein